jgi:hypothetical protein
MERRQRFAQGQIPVTQRQGALEIENGDPFSFPSFDLQTHMTSLRDSPQYLFSDVRSKFNTGIY